MSGSPTGGGGDAQYVVLSSDTALPNERILTAGSNIILTDAGAGSSLTISAMPGGVYPQVQIASNGLFYADSGFQYVANSAVLMGTGTNLVFNSNSGSNTRCVYTISNTYLEFYINGEIRLQM